MFARRKRRPVAPDRDAVVDRALCLSAVAMLGAIAASLEDGSMDSEQAGDYLRETHRWLIREKLAPALSSRERALLAGSLSDWTHRDAAGASWRNEALGVLLWALRVFEDMPAYDARFERLPSVVPLLAPTTEFRRAASLRSPEDIGRARDLAAGAHATAEAYAGTSAAFERHYALNWLCGHASDWDSVPTDT